MQLSLGLMTGEELLDLEDPTDNKTTIREEWWAIKPLALIYDFPEDPSLKDKHSAMGGV